MGLGSNTFYSFAGIVLAIEGQGEAAEALREYWHLYEVGGHSIEEAQIVLAVHESLEDLSIDARYYSLAGKMAFNEQEFRISRGERAFKVSNLFTPNAPTRIDLYYPTKHSLHAKLSSFRHIFTVRPVKYVDRYIESISDYSCLLWLLAVALMKNGRVFIHSGMCTRGRHGIIFCGTGGSGKTSMMFEMLNDEEFQYIAEDFGVLSEQGCIYSVPKRPTIYASDTQYGNKIILKGMKSLPLILKLKWKFWNFFGLNPRYRFPLDKFFDKGKYAEVSIISEIFYLARCSKNVIEKSVVPKEKILNKVAMASFREMNMLYEVLCNIHAVGDDEIQSYYPTLEMLLEQYKAILSEGLRNAVCYEIRVPLKYGPNEIIQAISDMVSS